MLQNCRVQEFSLIQLVTFNLFTNLDFNYVFSDSLQLKPGFNYNLNVVKEFVVTNDFLNLPQDVRECSEEPEKVCESKKLISKLTRKCECLPLGLKTSNYSQVLLLKETKILNIHMRLKLVDQKNCQLALKMKRKCLVL